MKGVKSSKQLADVQEKRTSLLRRIQIWREVQLTYMPHVASIISQTQSSPDMDGGIHPEAVPLYLPSSLPAHIRNLPEMKSLCQLECRLREPQADDALGDVRRQRRIIQGLWQFKRINVSGTGNKPNTRMLVLYKRLESKTNRATQKYRVAYAALKVLDPNGSWRTRLKVLADKDVSGPGRDHNSESTNSRYEPSWIWLMPRVNKSTNADTGLDGEEEEFNESMRVEWAKTRARKARWTEEVMILQEEMRRVISFQKWKAAWWRGQAMVRNEGDAAILSGVAGYANKQAAICERLAAKCAMHWLPQLKTKGIIPGWAAEYEVLGQAQSHDLPQVDNEMDDDTDLDDEDIDDEDIDDVLLD
jgi:hypothetical protein